MKKAKTTGQLIKQLQPIFNKYIRLRDAHKPCVSCGEYFDDKDAGHFVAKSTCSSLRFDEDNTHGECKGCNRFNESHLIGYSKNLKERIGDEDYNALIKRWEDYKKNPRKWTRGELRELIEIYKQKVKEYEAS